MLSLNILVLLWRRLLLCQQPGGCPVLSDYIPALPIPLCFPPQHRGSYPYAGNPERSATICIDCPIPELLKKHCYERDSYDIHSYSEARQAAWQDPSSCHLASASHPCRHLPPTHGRARPRPSPAPSQLPIGRRCLLGTKPALPPQPLTKGTRARGHRLLRPANPGNTNAQCSSWSGHLLLPLLRC